MIVSSPVGKYVTFIVLAAVLYAFWTDGSLSMAFDFFLEMFS